MVSQLASIKNLYYIFKRGFPNNLVGGVKSVAPKMHHVLVLVLIFFARENLSPLVLDLIVHIYMFFFFLYPLISSERTVKLWQQVGLQDKTIKRNLVKITIFQMPTWSIRLVLNLLAPSFSLFLFIHIWLQREIRWPKTTLNNDGHEPMHNCMYTIMSQSYCRTQICTQ